MTRVGVRARGVVLGTLAAVTVLLIACGQVGTFSLANDAGTSSSPSASANVVPFVPLPPQGQKIPAAMTPASPSPAPRSLALCRAAQLRAKKPRSGAAAGTVYATYTIRAAKGVRCRLQGVPKIIPADAAGRVRVPVERMPSLIFGGPWKGGVEVTPTTPAQVVLAWADADWCAPAVELTRLLVPLPGGSFALPAAWHSGACGSGPGGKARSPLLVGAFTPSKYHPAETVSVWGHAVHATTSFGDVTATAGQPLDLVATVEADRNLAIGACPDYVVELLDGKQVAKDTYQLNCAGITTVNDHGVPYLPANVPVSFAITVVVPASFPTGQPGKVSWQVRSPGLTLAEGGALKVTAASPSPSAP